MAALDAAIHEKHRTFDMLLNGRVKPGHDNGRSCYFIYSLEGRSPWPKLKAQTSQQCAEMLPGSRRRDRSRFVATGITGQFRPAPKCAASGGNLAHRRRKQPRTVRATGPAPEGFRASLRQARYGCNF